MLTLPLQMTLDEDGMAQFVVNISGNWKSISPEEVGAHILTRLRKTAEQNLTMPVKLAVLSVPAEFDQRQRNFTKSAAKLARLYSPAIHPFIKFGLL